MKKNYVSDTEIDNSLKNISFINKRYLIKYVVRFKDRIYTSRKYIINRFMQQELCMFV